MTMAKATTNGIVPMGVVAVKEKFMIPLLIQLLGVQLKCFMDIPIQECSSCCGGFSCSRYFEKEDILIEQIYHHIFRGLFSLKDIDCVENIRGYGMMGGSILKNLEDQEKQVI